MSDAETDPKHGAQAASGGSNDDTAPPTADEVTLFASRYRLDRLLGQGGMGAVYLALDTSLGRQVAIKMIRPDRADSRSISRFFREAQALGQVSHPAIVPLIDFGVDSASGSPYTVLRYIDGPSLADYIEQSGPVSEATARAWLEQLTSALGHAHTQGVIHRDVKPENIMLERVQSGAYEVRLTDFGLVKMENAVPMTRTGTRLGTPLYMAPEAAQGGKVDARADLYAVGCMIDVMVAGAPPFNEEDVWDLFDAHVSRPPPELPARLADGAPPSEGLRALRMQLLAKEVGDRPADAAEVVRRLREMAHDASPGDVTRPTVMGLDAGAVVLRSVSPPSDETHVRPGTAPMLASPMIVPKTKASSRGLAPASVPGAPAVTPGPSAPPERSRVTLFVGIALGALVMLAGQWLYGEVRRPRAVEDASPVVSSPAPAALPSPVATAPPPSLAPVAVRPSASPGASPVAPSPTPSATRRARPVASSAPSPAASSAPASAEPPPSPTQPARVMPLFK